MWNHSRRFSRFGDEDCDEAAKISSVKGRIEKSLDLTQYLKYLDNLFSQATSESETSDNEDDESQTFTNFLQPHAQPSDRSQIPQYNQGVPGSSTTTTSTTNPLPSFSAFKASDNFYLDASISSSSISSIDSGTSSLSLRLSNDFYPDLPSAKREGKIPPAYPSLKGLNLCTDSSSSTPGTDDDKPNNRRDKDKKSRKKRKTAKGPGETIPRQNKPSSDGHGNNGSRGGYAGGSSSMGSDSGEAFTNSETGNSSSSHRTNEGSSETKRSAQCMEQNGKVVSEFAISRESYDLCVSEINQCLNSLSDDHPKPLPNSDIALLTGYQTDHFGNEVLASSGLDAHDANLVNTLKSFGFTNMLDIGDDECIFNDYISMAASINAQCLPSIPTTVSESSTNDDFGKLVPIAETTETISTNGRTEAPGSSQKRKPDPVSRDQELPGKLIKLTDKQKQSRIEFLNAKRKKIYIGICRKEIGKTQRNRANIFKESLQMKRKLAQACERHLRRQAQQSEKCMQESVCKAKRLTQEMEMYWKLTDKAEREFQRAKEKEAEERRKQEAEVLSRIARENKFNLLITHIELFSTKIRKVQNEQYEEQQILSPLDDINGHVDGKTLRNSVRNIVDHAVSEHCSLVKLLDMSKLYPSENLSPQTEFTQPLMFEGILKNYQIEGIKWIKSLYMKGLNGILADEMAVGNMTQIIAFLCHLVESCDLWGPYLIVCPTSVLEVWQQLFDRLSPGLKVVLYSGKPLEKKNLTRIGERSKPSTKDSNFSVVLTSYQVMTSDLTYFGKVKWQYLVLDDSQGAVSSSTKWMPLLSFRCRNKLLLSDRPHSTSNTCAYLYFIMPSLFDSHEELSEWLLQELESVSTRKHNEIGEKSWVRLRSVVQKFLLCRTKQEVKNNVTDNVNVKLLCPLSTRQKCIYANLLAKTSSRHILKTLDIGNLEEKKRKIKQLLNLSVLLLKTCSHPDLVRKRHERLSYYMPMEEIILPNMIFLKRPSLDESLSNSSVGLVNRKFSIYNSSHIHESLFKEYNNVTKRAPTSWSFTRLLELSCSEVEKVFKQSYSSRLIHLVNFQSVLERLIFESTWKNYGCERVNFVQYPSILLQHTLRHNKMLENLVFTSSFPSMYSWGSCANSGKPENMEFRSLRGKGKFLLQQLYLPEFTQFVPEKVVAGGYKSKVLCSRAQNNFVSASLGRVISNTFVNDSKHRDADVLLRNAYYANRMSKILPRGHDQFIQDSGKLRRLDGLLSILKSNASGVLLCSHSQENLHLLEEFLAFRKFKFARIREGMGSQPDAFVYTIFVGKSNANVLNIPADTIIIFDQDYSTSSDTRTIISRLVAKPAHVNLFHLISKDTIEERFKHFAGEKNPGFAVKYKSMEFSLNNLFHALKCEFEPETYCSNNKLTTKCTPTDKSCQGLELNSRDTYNLLNGESSCITFEEKYTSTNCLPGRIESDFLYSSESSMEEDTEDVKKDFAKDTFVFRFDDSSAGMSPDSYEENAKSDYEDDSSSLQGRERRGSGKRGRPPRARFQKRGLDGGSLLRRGPGRPRLKPVGPSNQGIRGRKPGRPPLTKKAEAISSSLTSLAPGQRVYGFYGTSDLEFS